MRSHTDPDTAAHGKEGFKQVVFFLLRKKQQFNAEYCCMKVLALDMLV